MNFYGPWRDAAEVVIEASPEIATRPLIGQSTLSSRLHAGIAASRLSRLGRNLAVAGALTEARNRGYDEGESAGFDFGYADACNGRAGC